ncbi:12S seed storage globulin 1 [Glycine soja]
MKLQAYTPEDNFTISCGTTGIVFDGQRTWTGDADTKYLSGGQGSTVLTQAATQDPSVNQVPYTTARLSPSQFNYSFPVSAGPKFVRLFFYPADYPSFFYPEDKVWVVVLNTKNLPLVGEVGLGADLVRLDGKAMCSPGFSCDSAFQVTYIVRGSGRAQVVGADGRRVLETTVKAGNLFIVPRFFVVSKIADSDGLEWFSIITTPNPVFTHLAGSIGAWKALSPTVLQAAFNVDAGLEQLFRSKRNADAIFFPPPN